MLHFSTEEAFAIKVCSGLFAGFGLILWSAIQDETANLKHWLDIYLGMLSGGIIGARLFFVVTRYELFWEQPLNIPRIWFGELAWQGAILGGLAGMWLGCRWRKVDFDTFADGTALAFPVGFMAVCYASRSAGLLLGHPVADLDAHPVWMASFLPDINRDVIPRYELQMLGVGLGAGMLLIVTALTLSHQLEYCRLWIILCLTGLSILILSRYSALNGILIFGVDLNPLSALILSGVSLGILLQSVKRRANSVSLPIADQL
jgi:phosphatidylglycerol:prolipoprotein diacylglycerol transferase